MKITNIINYVVVWAIAVLAIWHKTKGRKLKQKDSIDTAFGMLKDMTPEERQKFDEATRRRKQTHEKEGVNRV